MGSQSQRLSRDEQRKPKPKPKPSSTQHEPKLPRNGEAGTKLTDQDLILKTEDKGRASKAEMRRRKH